MALASEGTPLLLPHRDKNTIVRNEAWNSTTMRRRFLFLIGCIGLVGVVATVGVFNPRSSDETSHAPLTRSSRSAKSEPTKLTVDTVRQLAKKMGSTFLDGHGHDKICSTDGCIDSAARLLHSINFSVNPCDDFYEFACGRWLVENELPPSYSRWSQFSILSQQVNNMTQDILSVEKDPEDPNSINQAKDFYKNCIDVGAREAVGVKPIQDALQLPKHGHWPILIGSDWKLPSFDWLRTIGDLRRVYLDTAIISIYVDQDMRDSDNYAIYIDQPSLVVPRDVLINEGGSFDTILAAYKEYIIAAVGILAADAGGDSPDPENVENEALELIAFEQKIANLTTKDELRSNVDRMYNPFKIPDYQKKTDSYGDLSGHLGVPLHWLSLLNTVFETSGVTLSPDTRVVVLETGYFENIIPLLLSTDPRTIANYLQLRYVSGLGGETTKGMRDIAFKFKQALTGAKEPQTIEQTCADSSNNGLGLAVGVKYISAAHFGEDGKAEVNSMVEDIRASFKELVTDANWMDNGTKSTAQDKANKIRTFMAFPDWYKDQAKEQLDKYYAKLEIVRGDHIQSITQLCQWSGDKALAKLGTPVDRTEWLTTPPVVNAFYAPSYNSITFPAGILQVPFFKHGSPASLNYGGIGVVIGHELTHGFDNSGRQYNAKGTAANWWSNDTLAKYTEKANCIRDQYSAFKPAEVEQHVNGLLTLGENIADNGGVRESFLAYEKYISENGVEGRLPGLEKLEPLQLFFLGYATIWCEAITDEALTNLLLTDPHSPARFRVRGPLSNNADFAEQWKCPSGSVMNPAPEERCILW